MTARATVSVVCPTFNRSAAIVPTIRSVLDQSVDAIELIVVLDGCTDDTEDVVNELGAADGRVRALPVARCGHPAQPRNMALERARGRFVAYIDHDDIWRPDHLEVALRTIGLDAAAATTAIVRSDGQPSLPPQPELAMCWHPELQLMAPLIRPSSLIHRAGVVERAGGWRAGAGLEDWDLWVRLADHGVNVATTVARTVVAFASPVTRINRVRRPHRMTVARLDDARTAAQLADSLHELSRTERFRVARRDDLRDWYVRLESSPRFRRPIGWHDDLISSVDDAFAADRSGWLDELEVRPTVSGAELQCPLWCASASHAQRLVAVHRRVMRRQVAMVDDAVASYRRVA